MKIRMLWSRFNDQLALLLALLIVGIWIVDPIIAQYYGIPISRDVIGATVVIFTLIAQFYFRRREPNGENGKPPEIK